MSKKIFYLILGAVAIFLPFGIQAATFSFTPSASYEATCPANIDILINTDGATSNAADAFINFNPNEIVIDGVTAGTAYDTYIKPKIDNVAGTIKYTAYGGSLSGSAVFGHIRFHSKGVGNTKFGWNFVLGSTTDSNIAQLSDSSDILTSVAESAYTFTPTDGYCDEDTVAPTIDTQVPLPGSINQTLDSDISFVFRDNRSGVDINSVVVKITNDGITTQYTPSNANFEHALISQGIYSILIKPYPNFVSKKLVTVQVTGSDLVGNKGGGSWSFNEPQSDCESLGCEGTGPTMVCAQNLSLLASPGNKQVALEWLPSLSVLGFEKILINRSECADTLKFPTPSSGQKVYDNTGSLYTDGGLTNGIQYCYSAYGYRSNNGAIEYSAGAFARAIPNCYMQPVTNFQVVPQNSGMLLSWNNPIASNLGSIKIIRKENACPVSGVSSDWKGGNIVYDGTGEGFLDVNALPGKEFCYLAFAYSSDGCFSPGALENTNLVYVTSTDGFTPQYRYYTNGGILELAPSSGNLNLLAGRDLTITTESKFLKPVENIVASIGNNSYSLSYNPESAQYSLYLKNFSEVGTLKGDLIVIYSDQTIQKTPLSITLNPLGKILDFVSRKQVSGVEVVLADSAGNIFVGANQKNPLTTGGDGSYGFMVPNGRYKIIVRQNGQEKYRGGLIAVNNNIVNSEVVLSPAVVAALNNIAQSVAESIKSPEVQTANNYTAPAVATLAAVNAIASIPWWNFWYYLQYLFTEFIPWLFKRKRKGWGVVYNSITKAPIDLAVIRFYDNTTKKLIQSKITDKQGRYIFLAEG
ncbi:MAG: Ig-like domain-containing protein, partial [Patescibacteria group bacterium]